jgi:hypothetical protein
VTPVLAIPPLPSLFEEIAEDGLHGLPVCNVGFVKGHHVDEDDVSLVHEEVAEEVEVFCFGYPGVGLAV